jgi:glycosyltransferase involved in cell wall biosynthesis
MTSVHDPQDARIFHRQIAAMLDAGWEVTYAAPFSGYAAERPEQDGLATIDVTRSVGRHRLPSLRHARRVLRKHGRKHDVVLLHDPEILLATVGLRRLPPVVWDVHEDTSAALHVKSWLPRPVRPMAGAAVRRLERWAEEKHALLLAEVAYRARFDRTHPVIPNAVWYPPEVEPSGDSRVVYVGSVTRVRGAAELVAVGELLRTRTAGAVTLHVIGPADADTSALLDAAAAAGSLRWAGRLPNHEALQHVVGALAGLSLLHDAPNYRHSMPTKVVEYMAHGVPVVTTPLPLAAKLVREADSGVVVPFHDPEAVVAAILELREDSERRQIVAKNGRDRAQRWDWSVTSREFLAAIEAAAQREAALS